MSNLSPNCQGLISLAGLLGPECNALQARWQCR